MRCIYAPHRGEFAGGRGQPVANVATGSVVDTVATTKTLRPAAKRRRPAARKTSIWQRIRTSLATHLGRQADEVWGLVLVVAGVLAALSIYADLTGPAGRFV